MSRSEFLKAKGRLLIGYTKMADESRQAIRDIEYWNKHVKPEDCPPEDPEPFRVALYCAERALTCIESNRPIPDDLMERVQQAMAD